MSRIALPFALMIARLCAQAEETASPGPIPARDEKARASDRPEVSPPPSTSRPHATAGAFRAAADFPGGAADVLRVDPASRTVRLKVPDQTGWRAWWYLRIDGTSPGETVRVEVEDKNTLEDKKCRPVRAVYSEDRRDWKFTGPGRSVKEDGATGATMAYEAKANGPAIWFAWYVPFVSSDAEAMARKAEKACPEAKRFELCRSEGGLSVVGLRVAAGHPSSPARPAVWIQARQHAWEVSGSWTVAGIVEWLVSDDPRAKALRAKADVTVIPNMNVDYVERGLSGKNYKPHDLNRDWTDKPIWNAVRAAMAELKQLDEAGQLKLFLDLHAPGWGWGGVEYWTDDVNQLTPLRKERVLRLIACMKEDWSGTNELWSLNGPIDPKYTKRLPISTNWVKANTREEVVGGALEIPVAPPKGFQGDPPAPHLALGRRLGLAIERFFR
jgi:hypothetical protein